MTKIRDDKFLKSLGKKVKEVRIQKNISTYDLSYESNVSRSQINSIEKGDINTTICTIKALADAMEVDIKDLLDF
ncbi:helix-turn-helix domain-containing protein [Flagellimonas pacifica]|uniref:DNA-binding transcriptional regulator, XRE-family HTH domain n=1 Tax=Flagellimonas pacifica TaxID=1247520 RepID=A0A285MZ53_9FLAO|nr:helix-turn-helix transcriptional regulator [Allomuricauda parva]SNZ01817.1 DNA-binding transcriptional regulator, XRE-family HTH domain [Allomuricauda parva]